MDFLEELVTLSENYKSPRLEEVKKLLRKEASDGKKSTNLNSQFYDPWVINYLRAQGITVEEVMDQRDGDFIRISWNKSLMKLK